MRLTLLRHGQSANNAAWVDADGDLRRYARVPEPRLTPLGHEQAAAAAAWFAALGPRERVTHVLASPMARAVQTAVPVARALGLPLGLSLGAFEVGGPYVTDEAGVRSAHPGLTRADLAELAPDVAPPQELREDGWWAGPYESASATQERAAALVTDLRASHPDAAHVLLVTHQAFCGPLTGALGGFAPPPGFVRVGNAATCSFELGVDGAECLWLNGSEHLPAPLRTG